MAPPPCKRGFFPTSGHVMTQRQVDIPELFWLESLDLIKTRDNKTQCRKLTWACMGKLRGAKGKVRVVLTIRNNPSNLLEARLQSKGLQSGERCADAKVQYYSGLNGRCLRIVQFAWILGSIMDLPICTVCTSGKLGRDECTHWAIIALKRARFTTMFGFALRHTFTISAPMFSPSLSQSVQIMTC